MRSSLLLACALGAAGLAGAQEAGVAPAARTVHRFYVACESSDEVYRLAFDGESLRVERAIEVGYQPTEVEGPHGLTVDPEGEHWYLSIAHGKPFGLLYKYRTSDDELLGECELGMFPATMQISAATGLLYCVNFNLHGRMLPSTVSIVDPDAMVEVGRTSTGPMPHGSRLSPDGRFHYSCAMMSGHLFELDAVTFDVTRNLQLDVEPPEGHASAAKPTWVQPHPGGEALHCALNGKDQIVEVSRTEWQIARRFECAGAPYNLDVTPDGALLVVTCKKTGEIAVLDVASGAERARIPSLRKVTHGVVISPDGRFAFVTSEGIGAEPGGVDVIDLQTLKKVASAEVGLQAGGIAYWKAEPVDGQR